MTGPLQLAFNVGKISKEQLTVFRAVIVSPKLPSPSLVPVQLDRSPVNSTRQGEDWSETYPFVSHGFMRLCKSGISAWKTRYLVQCISFYIVPAEYLRSLTGGSHRSS